MDERLDVIYLNEKVVREEWHTFEVGVTRFTDEALRQAGKSRLRSTFLISPLRLTSSPGEMVIHNMRQKRPAYNLISNNCQTYATQLLEAIQIGAHQAFATTFAIYVCGSSGELLV